jgi:hypothetical protein
MKAPVERGTAERRSRMADLIAAGTFAFLGAALLVAPALWHIVTFGDSSEPSPVDPDLAFYCAGALVLLVPIVGVWAIGRRFHVAAWTCVVIGMATMLFWACQIKFIFFGPWST